MTRTATFTIPAGTPARAIAQAFDEAAAKLVARAQRVTSGGLPSRLLRTAERHVTSPVTSDRK